MKVFFNKEAHSYTNEDGKIYTSVTTLISKVFPEFKADMIASILAKKQGTTADKIKDEWKAKATEGTRLHNLIENDIFFDEGVLIENHSNFTDGFYKLTDIDANYPEYPYQAVFTESLLYSHKHSIAGTADLIIKDGNSFFVLDFKTGIKEDIGRVFSGKVEGLPNVKNSKLHRYSLQTWVYGCLLKEMFGIEIKDTFIIPIDSDYNNKPSGLFSSFVNTLNFRTEASKLLDMNL